MDKRIDVIAVAIQAGMTVFDPEEMELCYTPQFGSAKDAVNMAGFVAGATVMDFGDGPHPRQTFDFWRVPGTETAPVLVFIHGGGWLGRDKNDSSAGFRATVAGWHERGISVANVNYRYSSDAPLPAPVHHAARAIQVMRSKATEWGIDRLRIAAIGHSAGGCTSLWLATHDDLADPAAADPVYEHAEKVFYEFSPINHLSPDDPPVWMNYHGPVSDPGEGIHSARFGVIFKQRADEVGVPCWLGVQKNPDLHAPMPDMQKFIVDVPAPARR